MRTEKQIAASRVNGAKSRGPITPEGKKRSSQNAITHGLYATSVLLPGESEQTWNESCAVLLRRFQPEAEIERGAIHRMAAATWRRERAEGVEAQLLDREIAVASTPATAKPELRQVAEAYQSVLGRSRAISEVQREISRLSRQWRQLHDKLRVLQAARKENIENEPKKTRSFIQ